MENCNDFVVIGDENCDLLNSGYLQHFSDGSCEYPSVEHFCQCQILTYLGLISEAQQVLDEKTAALARARSYCIIQQRFGATMDPERLKRYVLESRDTFIRHGLYIRLQKDGIFRQKLLETGKAVLVFCDGQDFEGGVGMDRDTFITWVQDNKIKPGSLVYWMLNPGSYSDVRIGRNKLGFILMSVRDSLIDSRAVASSNTEVSENLRLFTVGSLTVSEQVLCLTGIFQPLSNYYALPFTVQANRYRSVEHFVYLRFFQSLGMEEKLQEKLRTTSDPGKVYQVAMQILKRTKIKSDKYYSKLTKTLGWYRKAICHKLSQHTLLRRLLLATGNALLVECNCQDDKEWSVGAEEREIQHLLSKQYISPDNFLRWMLSIDRAPNTMQHFGSNMTGIVLMELRKQLRETESVKETPLSLILPADSAIPDLLTEHLICFTADSVFHPLYPTMVDKDSKSYLSVQHFVSAKQAEHFGLPENFVDWVLECPTGHETAQMVAEEMEIRYPSLERLYNWEYKEAVEAYKTGLRLRLEQHPAVLKALLDTGDAFLVFCQRFLTSQCQYSIGIREYDLRCWLHYAEIDTRELAKLCMLPLSKRPPFLGGNRLGFILMELRREFTLSGVFPQNLPELDLKSEDILGSDSLKENLDLYEEFDLNMDHENSLWPSMIVP